MAGGSEGPEGLTENDGHEIARRENDGPKMTTGRKVAGEQIEF